MGLHFCQWMLAILSKLNGIMNAEQVLIHHSILSGKHLIGNGFIFHHDNDLDPNTAAKCGDNYRLERQTAYKTLNIIEAVWDHLDRERNKRQPKSKKELWEVLKEAWYIIPEDYFRKPQNSLPKKSSGCA